MWRHAAIIELPLHRKTTGSYSSFLRAADRAIQLFRAPLGVKTGWRDTGQVLHLANQVGLVGVTVAIRERGPRGPRNGIGRAQQRVKALNAGEVARRDARLVHHET